ncbi:hypothetical protein QYM36_010576 [Artemia franciscana]|uniref:Uncharacterized protein n=1 Tax=Artemia franciscana TaxID=6661 RepID=A0AA88HXL4_ARTSF|nr:hypothetical protein QYM36_010576 [Artemia franciscana]
MQLALVNLSAPMTLRRKPLPFFGMDSTMAAKEPVWTHANLATRVTSRKKNPADTVVDIVKAIQQFDEKKISLPRYVILNLMRFQKLLVRLALL